MINTKKILASPVLLIVTSCLVQVFLAILGAAACGALDKDNAVPKDSPCGPVLGGLIYSLPLLVAYATTAYLILAVFDAV